jgi:hypothetical protein
MGTRLLFLRKATVNIYLFEVVINTNVSRNPSRSLNPENLIFTIYIGVLEMDS